MNSITLFLVAVCVLAGLAIGQSVNNSYLAPPFFGAAAIIAFSLKMANAWQKFVFLRMGKRQKERGATILLPSSMVDNLNFRNESGTFASD